MDKLINAKIEISLKTIFVLLACLLGLKILIDIREFIIALFIALIFSSVLKQPIQYLEEKKIHRIIATLLVFCGVLVVGTLIVSWIMPSIIEETVLFSRSFPRILSDAELAFPPLRDLLSSLNIIPTITQQALGLVGALFSNTIFFASTIFMTIYLSFDPRVVQSLFVHIFHQENQERIHTIVLKVEKSLGAWMAGELVLMTIVGLLTYIGLTIIGVPYSVPLALIAGLLEIIPNIGPTMAAVPAFFVGLTVSPIVGAYSIIVAIVVQQLENQLIVPLVMKKATGFHPIATLFFLVVGGEYAGVLGVLLAIPAALVVFAILEGLRIYKKS